MIQTSIYVQTPQTIDTLAAFVKINCTYNRTARYRKPLINSRKRVIRVNSTEDDVHLVVRDKGLGRENKSTQNSQNKSIQATEWRRREAWSAEQADLRTKPTQWKFNKRNYRPKEAASTPGDLRQDHVPAAANDYNDARQSFRLR